MGFNINRLMKIKESKSMLLKPNLNLLLKTIRINIRPALTTLGEYAVMTIYNIRINDISKSLILSLIFALTMIFLTIKTNSPTCNPETANK